MAARCCSPWRCCGGASTATAVSAGVARSWRRPPHPEESAMRTVRRLFYVDIVSAVAFVAIAFLSLSFFIDFVDELADVGQRGYTALHAALHSLLLLPGHFYEVAPIAVLIGTIYTLSRMAQS